MTCFYRVKKRLNSDGNGDLPLHSTFFCFTFRLLMTTERILLIDDDTDDQLFFTDAVGDINPGIICEIAGHGLEGLKKLQSGSLPDVIFLDLNMPIMNGFDFLEKFRENEDWKNVPVVIYSTSNQQCDMERAQQLGAQAFLTKPSSMQELHSSLERLLNFDFSEISQQITIF